jgi:hypothetical protein
MNLEFIVEEPSMEETLKNILPKMLKPEITFRIINMRNKQNLINNLSKNLSLYKKDFFKHHKIVVLVDQDKENCLVLKQTLEEAARNNGLTTKSSANFGSTFQVLNRIVIEEIESWFFGDINALTSAYPKISKNLLNIAKYRDPDKIKGGTWEALEKLLQKYGYFRNGLSKIRNAQNISQYMDPNLNRSRSFQVFREGLEDLVSI